MITPGDGYNGFTDMGRELLLRLLLNIPSQGSPEQVWFGFLTGPEPLTGGRQDGEVPAQYVNERYEPDGSGGMVLVTETVDTGYARAAYPFASSEGYWEPVRSGVVVNSQDIVFPQSAGGWPLVKSWMMCDSAEGGNALLSGSVSVTVPPAAVLVIPARSVRIGFERPVML
jgi:hypothetical protein